MTNLGIAGLSQASPYTSGGSSVIYEAWQDDFDRRVAVKILRGAADEATTRRFQRERQAAGRLSGHPGIVDVYAGGVTDSGELYLIMPFMEAGSLQDELNRGGRFGLEQAVRDVSAVAEALEFAHRQGVIHRDIKPANILRDSSGRAMITDFGIARLLDGQTADGTINATTPLYAAPEVLGEAAATVASDVYSLGALLYALLAGRPAFSRGENENIWTIMDRIRLEEPPHIPDVPMQVMDVIRGAMAKTPINRPTSARLFAQYLRFALHEATHNPRPDEIRTKHQLRLPADDVYGSQFGGPAGGPTRIAPPAPPASRGRSAMAQVMSSWAGRAAAVVGLVVVAGLGLWAINSSGDPGIAVATDEEISEADRKAREATARSIEIAAGANPQPGTADDSGNAPADAPTTDDAIVLGATVTADDVDTQADVDATAEAIPVTVSEGEPSPEPDDADWVQDPADADNDDAPEPTYDGQRFAALVPVDWSTQRSNVDVGYGYRSEFRANGPGSDFLIVDTTPKNRATPGVSIEESARSVANSLRSASPVVYEQIGDKDTWWFSYTGDDGSQRIDIFFEVDGNGYAVIGGSHGDPESAFEAARAFVGSLQNKQ